MNRAPGPPLVRTFNAAGAPLATVGLEKQRLIRGMGWTHERELIGATLGNRPPLPSPVVSGERVQGQGCTRQTPPFSFHSPQLSTSAAK